MGYTHYWEMQRDFTDDEWTRITEGAREIAEKCKQHFDFGNWGGSHRVKFPTINETKIAFNGVGDDSHETFFLTKEATVEDWRTAHFAFCKTARKPYDIGVVSILAWAKRVAPDAINISSDGEEDVFEKGTYQYRDIGVLQPDTPLEKLSKRLNHDS